ncbi:MAG: hypothetical protein ACK5IJ_04390 [Mangrovibacterium sp.]
MFSLIQFLNLSTNIQKKLEIVYKSSTYALKKTIKVLEHLGAWQSLASIQAFATGLSASIFCFVPQQKDFRANPSRGYRHQEGMRLIIEK